MKYPTINGWTRETMKAAIRAGNNGTRARAEKTDRCLYLTADGNKCAVGCFIPDGHRAQKAKHAIHTLLVAYPELFASMPLGVRDLNYMQAEHDEYLGPDDMRDILCTWIDANVEDAP